MSRHFFRPIDLQLCARSQHGNMDACHAIGSAASVCANVLSNTELDSVETGPIGTHAVRNQEGGHGPQVMQGVKVTVYSSSRLYPCLDVDLDLTGTNICRIQCPGIAS